MSSCVELRWKACGTFAEKKMVVLVVIVVVVMMVGMVVVGMVVVKDHEMDGGTKLNKFN